MEFNNFVFPAPNFEYHLLEILKEKMIFIPSKDNHYIPCLFLHNEKEISKNFIIFFHGNAEDMFYSNEMARALQEITGMNVIIVEYPGYSIYKGEANSTKILENTTIIYDFIKTQFNLEDKNMFVFGRSIGTSPAIYLASVRKPNALFVVSSFTSIRAVAGNLVGPLKYLLKQRFTSEEYIKNVTCPIFFVHGKSDPLIPYTETIALTKICKSKYELLTPSHMTHNDFDLYEDIIEPIQKFIENNCTIDNGKINIDDIKNDIDKLHKMPQEIEFYIRDLKDKVK
jgi:esterase/lipase